MRFPLLSCWISLLVLCTSAVAETVKDREGAVRNDRAAMEGSARWIYNDWQRGFAEAKRTGKPLLVVLRCVPCLACAGIDAAVLLEESELDPLLDQFVCVRLINANTLDLSLFQFDYDLSFSTLFFNGDGTVYGRYGSWKHQKDTADRTTNELKYALEAALQTHRAYPANKASLAGKQGASLPFKTPVEMPTISGRYGPELNWTGKVVQSCVHCHQVGDALREHYRSMDEPVPGEWIYPYPAPETIGLTLHTQDGLEIASVASNTVAAESGLRDGDQLLALAGQPLISAADVSWVLHRAPETGSLKATVKRSGMEVSADLVLPSGWRQMSDISRRVGTWTMRAMATGGLLLESLSEEERKEQGIKAGQMALRVKHAGEYGKHAAAKRAGFQKGDVLVMVEGVTGDRTESELIGDLLSKHRPGEQVKTTVLRDSQRVDLLLPVQ